MTDWGTSVQQRLGQLQNHASLLYWPYILSAFVFTFLFLKLVSKMKVGDALRLIGSPKVWLTRSTRTDVVMTLIHEMFVLAPTFALSAWVSDRVLGGLHGQLRPPAHDPLGWAPPIVVQSVVVTIAVMLAVDLGTFVAHRLHHAFPVLWEIHAVHHSAAQLTLFTAHRVHPIEALLRGAIQGVFTGCVTFGIKAAFGQLAPIFSVWGMGVGFFVFSFANNLLHSHVPVRYPKWLRQLLLSPHIHHLHHSRALRHQNRNFGAMFPYWDRLCGTYLDEEFLPGEIAFGLDGPEDAFRHSIIGCYVYPLVVPIEKLLQLVRRQKHPSTSM
jgi:sterol desaturase/sphingolipid hydroxylase (fatty acid hydroxylase superfamily)